MALKLLHEYTTTYRVVTEIRMLYTHYQTLMSRYKAILKPYQLGNYQYENTVLSYYISTLLLCTKRNLSHATIACTVIIYYYKCTVIIPTGKWSYQEWKHHI